jgi:hypothetical protein
MALSPSQRVTLIKEIANRLGSDTWSAIDVTLRAFGLKPSDSFSGDSASYCMAMVERASDQTLVDLAQHLGFNFEEATSPRVDPDFWRDGMLRLFLSHLATQRRFAADLQTALARFGISAFVAHNDIHPTTEWQAQIELALNTCDALVAVLHPNFHESLWTDQEIGFAMGRGLPAFAIKLGVDPYGFIGRFQAFNAAGKTPAVLAAEIFEAFCANKQTRRLMSESAVRLFEGSRTFAEAKERIGLLEMLDFWTPSFGDRVLKAAEVNSQVTGSFGVPGRVNRLIRKRSKS